MNDTTQLVCPDCGCTRLSWTITQEQIGDYFEFSNGNRGGECYDEGPILESSADISCTGCDGLYHESDLVAESEVDDD